MALRNKMEEMMIGKIEGRISRVNARTMPPIESAIEAAVETIASEMDILERKPMVLHLYKIFTIDIVVRILTKLADRGITIPS